MKVYGSTRTRVVALRGETFAIDLKATPGAGFEWQAAWDERRLTVKKEITPEDGSSVGGAATERFLVTAVDEGEWPITLTYRQPWTGGLVESSYVVQVVVKGKSA